jgi:hypothetical protein
MNKLITKLGGGPGLFWIGILIVAIILIVVFLTGNDGGHRHAH